MNSHAENTNTSDLIHHGVPQEHATHTTDQRTETNHVVDQEHLVHSEQMHKNQERVEENSKHRIRNTKQHRTFLVIKNSQDTLHRGLTVTISVHTVTVFGFETGIDPNSVLVVGGEGRTVETDGVVDVEFLESEEPQNHCNDRDTS